MTRRVEVTITAIAPKDLEVHEVIVNLKDSINSIVEYLQDSGLTQIKHTKRLVHTRSARASKADA